jgi:hypothetical protein
MAPQCSMLVNAFRPFLKTRPRRCEALPATGHTWFHHVDVRFIVRRFRNGGMEI